MMEFSISQLAKITGANPPGGFESAFGGVSIDSRTVKKGDCFFAIEGENFDGHDFVNQAFDKGAVCAVVSKAIKGNRILRVDDTTAALGKLAAEYRRGMGFKVVAITGSVGKTTTRQIVYHILKSRFKVHQSPGNFNNQIGLPLTLLGADADTEIVIAEIGSNRPGEVGYLTKIASPDIAVVTSIGQAHLEGFGTLEAIVDEKLSISQGLRGGGKFIINGDFEKLVAKCRQKDLKFTTFGQSENCDIQTCNVDCSGLSGRFTIEGVQIDLPLAGYGNIENAAAAWAVCSEFALTIDEFAGGVKTFSAIPMRAELLKIGNLTVLNDCYNANPASMKNALDILINLSEDRKGRVVFVCGDMVELGADTERLHKDLGMEIAKANVEVVLAVGELAKIAAETAKEAVGNALEINCFEDSICACDNLEKFIKDNDVVLVKGSRSVGLERVVDRLKELFS